MIQYIIRRLIQAVFVVLGVVTVVFFVLRLTGDPVVLLLGATASEADIQNVRHNLGLDRPLYVQYVYFIRNVLHADFGQSIRFRGFNAMHIVLDRYPRTIELAICALVFSVTFSVIFGVIAAVKRYTIFDNIVTFLALFGQSVPNFWLGIMLILIFAVRFGWLPSQGYGLSPRYFLLPMITLAVAGLARLTRLVRSGMLDVLSQDYVRTARAKGLRDQVVIFRHGLKNAAIPLVTVIGLDFGNLLAGAVITEQIFQWNGVGQLAVDSIGAHDYPVVQATVFIIAVTFVMINLLVDILYTWLDPRVRLS
jgi:ABC-type dipeptide/oligopeptide/nickel transport system permease component